MCDAQRNCVNLFWIKSEIHQTEQPIREWLTDTHLSATAPDGWPVVGKSASASLTVCLFLMQDINHVARQVIQTHLAAVQLFVVCLCVWSSWGNSTSLLHQSCNLLKMPSSPLEHLLCNFSLWCIMFITPILHVFIIFVFALCVQVLFCTLQDLVDKSVMALVRFGNYHSFLFFFS